MMENKAPHLTRHIVAELFTTYRVQRLISQTIREIAGDDWDRFGDYLLDVTDWTDEDRAPTDEYLAQFKELRNQAWDTVKTWLTIELIAFENMEKTK